MNNSEAIKKGMKLFKEDRYKLWIGSIIFLAVFLALCVLGTVILSIVVQVIDIQWNEELQDPAIYYFPYMIYIPYFIVLCSLFLLIISVLRIKNKEEYQHLRISDKFIPRMTIKIEWEDETQLWRKIIKKITLTFLISFTIMFIAMGIIFPELLISPMNTFYLTFMLSFTMLWITMGLKKENRNLILWFLVILTINIGLLIGVIFIAEDFKVLPFVLSYQVVAFMLMFIRYITCVFFEK
ncbi:MAG: hypothetical protein ACTSPI_17040 [Candidatus Heimdallarchaeaceae archaeon]